MKGRGTRHYDYQIIAWEGVLLLMVSCAFLEMRVILLIPILDGQATL